MYRVETERLAEEQVQQLPVEALAPYAELRVALETNPWGGEAYNPESGNPGVRGHAFGTAGFAVHLVLDEQRLVLIMRVIWLG